MCALFIVRGKMEEAFMSIYLLSNIKSSDLQSWTKYLEQIREIQ